VGLVILKYFNISLTSLGNLARIGGGSLLMLTSLSVFLFSFLPVLTGFILGVNLNETFCLKELLFLSAIREYYSEL